MRESRLSHDCALQFYDFANSQLIMGFSGCSDSLRSLICKLKEKVRDSPILRLCFGILRFYDRKCCSNWQVEKAVNSDAVCMPRFLRFYLLELFSYATLILPGPRESKPPTFGPFYREGRELPLIDTDNFVICAVSLCPDQFGWMQLLNKALFPYLKLTF